MTEVPPGSPYPNPPDSRGQWRDRPDQRTDPVSSPAPGPMSGQAPGPMSGPAPGPVSGQAPGPVVGATTGPGTGAAPGWQDQPAARPEVASAPREPSGTAPRPPRRVDWRRIAWLGGLVLFIALCGVGILAYIGYNYGPLAVLIGFGAAVLPVPLLVLAFLWLDRYEPEPIGYLAFAFLWGACVATLLAVAVEMGGETLLRRGGLPAGLVAVIVAPLVEESTKALGPILLFWRRRRAVSGIVDGLVYCGLSAAGFAMVENILYLGGIGYAVNAYHGGTSAGVRGLIVTFFVRIVLTGFAHPMFTAMTGIGLGIAARTRDRRVRWMAPLAGLLAAMMLHGLFNLMATVAGSAQPLVALYGYFSVMMPIFLALVGFAVWVRGSEARLTQTMLPFYVRAGWLSPPEVASLATVGRRLSARLWAKRVAGDGGAAAMRGYQFAATQLALLRDRMQRGMVESAPERESAAAEERRLLETISGYRAAYTGRDPYTPVAHWDGLTYQVAFPDGVTRSLPAPVEPVVPVPVPLGVPAFAGMPGVAGPPAAAGPGAMGPGPAGPGAMGPGSMGPGPAGPHPMRPAAPPGWHPGGTSWRSGGDPPAR